MKNLNNIHQKYPNIFKETTTISCGDGWYWLIDNLCEQINKRATYKKLNINISYIGEKFGVLNIKCNGCNDDAIWGYIEFATHLSSKMCEMCGSTKYLGKTSPWIKNLCINCGKEYENKSTLNNENKWIPNDDTIKEIRLDKLNNINKQQ